MRRHSSLTTLRTGGSALRQPLCQILIALVIVLCSLLSATVVLADEKADDFEKNVRPILVRNCQGCHSRETGKTSGGLALDTRRGWKTGGDNGEVIVPGKPEESRLIAAVRQTGDLKMPPPGKGAPLSATEISILSQWIASGAIDPRDDVERRGGLTADEARNWWAFQPLRLPRLADANRSRTEIDHLVDSTLGEKQLRATPQADRAMRLRRVTFDLTGLPPTVDDLNAFLADDSPDAWTRLIERLLASPAYGERWGRHWFDVARYADTAGDGADYPVREAYRYRNWVVKALNADLPFNEFVRQQLAGDILAKTAPNEQYADLVTATGFLAIGKRYGYAPNPDYQHLDFADAIDSIGRSLLGLSIGCARCHDHKYDPISIQDYYALYGVMQSTRWAFPGGEEHKRPTHFPPLVPPDEVARREADRAQQLARVDSEMATTQDSRDDVDPNWHAGGVDLGFERQEVGKPPSVAWLSAGPNSVVEAAQSPYQHVHPAGTKGVRIGSGVPTDGVRYVFARKLTAVAGGTLHLNVDFRTVADPATDDVTSKPSQNPGAYRFYLGRGVIESQALECSITNSEFALKNGEQWEVIRKVEPGTWYTLQINIDPDQKTYAGVVGTKDDLISFEKKGLSPRWDGVLDTFICDAIGHVGGTAPARDLDNVGLSRKAFPKVGSPAVPPRTDLPEWQEQRNQFEAELVRLKQKREALVTSELYPTAYGVSEGTPANARLQKRGEPETLGEEVPRRFLAVLGGDAISIAPNGSGRLEMAQWITERNSALLSRVFVNRVWQGHFGVGLVTTPSDFGTRGELPSHPELLELLAYRFVESGWSIKQLHRMILATEVYQRSSTATEHEQATDPTNRWLWRGQRRALDAESLRDAMLAVSGILDRSIPEAHPFPPTNTWAYTIHQPFHAVYDSYHRSTYLMQQRNRRHPFLALFDAADPNLSVASRLPTTTPNQTLFLMNSPFVHEQSRALAQRILQRHGDQTAKIRWLLESTTSQSPDEIEINDSIAFLDRYQRRLSEQGVTTQQAEASSWSALCRVVLTSNGFLSVD